MKTAAITIARLDTKIERDAAAERLAGMTREEAFRCCWAGCLRPGTTYLGTRHEYLVCDECAVLPRFTRHKTRVPARELYPWSFK